MYNNQFWRREALCAYETNSYLQENFFSEDPDEKHEAKNLCFSCPVRKNCLKYALESKEIWGIWGGKDENEIRRALSVDANGNEIRRGRYPHCPYCGARTKQLETYTVELTQKGRWKTARMVKCTECDFNWRSRTSANAVNAYHAKQNLKKGS